jgi:hypothetical protein
MYPVDLDCNSKPRHFDLHGAYTFVAKYFGNIDSIISGFHKRSSLASGTEIAILPGRQSPANTAR